MTWFVSSCYFVTLGNRTVELVTGLSLFRLDLVAKYWTGVTMIVTPSWKTQAHWPLDLLMRGSWLPSFDQLSPTDGIETSHRTDCFVQPCI
jgi:hypothetical protein